MGGLPNPDEIPTTLNQKKAKALYEANGWVATPGGKHQVKMTKEGCKRPVTLPQNKGRDYPPGLRAGILKQMVENDAPPNASGKEQP